MSAKHDEVRIPEAGLPDSVTEAQRTQMRRELAEELYDRDSGTCGCGCDCAFYVDPDCDRVTE